MVLEVNLFIRDICELFHISPGSEGLALPCDDDGSDVHSMAIHPAGGMSHFAHHLPNDIARRANLLLKEH